MNRRTKSKAKTTSRPRKVKVKNGFKFLSLLLLVLGVIFIVLILIGLQISNLDNRSKAAGISENPDSIALLVSPNPGFTPSPSPILRPSPLPSAYPKPSPSPLPYSSPKPSLKPSPFPSPYSSPTPILRPSPSPIIIKPSPTPLSSPIPAVLSISVRESSTWDKGFCAEFKVTNSTNVVVYDWLAKFDLNKAKINSMWGGTFTLNTTNNRYTVLPLSGSKTVYPNTSKTFGYCGTKLGANYMPSNLVVKVK